MVPPIETPNKTPDVHHGHHAPHPPLNERILSSMTRRSVAAHPWHDLEIGMQCHSKRWLLFLFNQCGKPII
jgi:inorganic pyrophosphatase